MSTTNVFSLPLLWIALSLIAGTQPMKAQNEPALSGSKIKSEDAVAMADAVFTGQITAIGFGNRKAKGESVYRGVQVKVLRLLRGNVDALITVTLHVVGMMDFHEDPPRA